MINPFFKNKGPFKIEKLLKLSDIDNIQNLNGMKVFDVKDLLSATSKDITFFHSKKYEAIAIKTKAKICITTKNLSNILPKSCEKIIVNNVLIAIAKITKSFYPKSVTDDFDKDVNDINKTVHKKKVEFGKNVLIGKNVKIGKNCSIGHNSIIEKNVVIGNNCSIGPPCFVRTCHFQGLSGCVLLAMSCGATTRLRNRRLSVLQWARTFSPPGQKRSEALQHFARPG